MKPYSCTSRETVKNQVKWKPKCSADGSNGKRALPLKPTDRRFISVPRCCESNNNENRGRDCVRWQTGIFDVLFKTDDNTMTWKTGKFLIKNTFYLCVSCIIRSFLLIICPTLPLIIVRRAHKQQFRVGIMKIQIKKVQTFKKRSTKTH